jgi:hypothetical protein
MTATPARRSMSLAPINSLRSSSCLSLGSGTRRPCSRTETSSWPAVICLVPSRALP